MGRFTIAFLLLLTTYVSASAANDNCMKYVVTLVNSIRNQNFAALPISTIMYSGITTNNPGQMYECKYKSGADPFSYMLVSFKNSTNSVETFTGICVPSSCSKEDIEAALSIIKLKYYSVYDYPEDEQSPDGLMIACAVILGIWVTILIVWSIILSCKEPVQNDFLKKDEEVRPLNASQEPVNSLIDERQKEKDDYKIFNFYQGYCRIFQRSNQKHIMGSILFLATFSIIFSTEFSYRQTIAANEVKSLSWFNSLGGVLFCNIEIAYSVIIFVLGTKLAYSLYRLSSFHEIGRYFFDQLLVKWAILVLTSMAAYVFLSLTDEPLNQLWKSKFGADCPSVMYQMWFVFRSLILDCKVCLQWFWIIEVDILLTILVAPLFIIYKTKKWVGIGLFILAALISTVFALAVLESDNIVFEPYKLFNQSLEYTVNYQTNALVRAAPFIIGFMMGLLVNEKMEKIESGNGQDLKIVNAIRGSSKVQGIMHLVGFALMFLTYLLIIPFLPVVEAGDKRQSAHFYMILAPLGFVIGLVVFLLPCLLQGEGKMTVLFKKVLGASFWTSLEKMSIGFLLLGPVVIGFTTYSMQNSIYFDFETVFVYFLGDSVIIYILTLLAVSSVDNQLMAISRWMQAKVFGNQSKYNVVVIEE